MSQRRVELWKKVTFDAKVIALEANNISKMLSFFLLFFLGGGGGAVISNKRFF